MCKQCKDLNKATNNTLTDHEPPRCEAVATCDYCGEIITAEMLEDGQAIKTIEDIYFCSSEHANAMNFYQCEGCGEYFNNDSPEVIATNYGRYTEHYAYCSEECAESDGCFKCENCGEWCRDADHKYRNRIYHNGQDYDYCDVDCAYNDGWETCEYCGEWYRAGDNEGVTAGGSCYCSAECAECEGYGCCEYCGEWGRREDMLDIGNGSYYCDAECADYAANGCGCYTQPFIKNYHHSNYNIEPRYLDEADRDAAASRRPIVGIELEVEPFDGDTPRGWYNLTGLIEGINERINNNAVFMDDTTGQRYEEPFCWFEIDGSLNAGGVEIITQPASEKFWNEFGGLFMDTVGHLADVNGYEYGASDNGGLHIHINKEYINGEAVARRLQMFLFLSHARLFEDNTGRPEKWGGYYSPLNGGGDSALSQILGGGRAGKIGNTHSAAVSERDNTYELRIFSNEIYEVKDHITQALELVRAAKSLSDTNIRTLNKWLRIDNGE